MIALQDCTVVFNANTPDERKALNEVRLMIERGDFVTVIGSNGAGKSTLLMVMAGIYAPDKGSLKTVGRVGSLLTLGAGFNNELTGRENIILSGICMGLSRREIISREKMIAEFSGLGDFMDAPIKTYSNGMRARLGFAIAVNIDPDILLIDEVLQAGDAAFQRKSGNILQSFQNQKKTIVVVTHSLPLVQQSCNRVILLKEGKVYASGPPKEVVGIYNELMAEQKKE